MNAWTRTNTYELERPNELALLLFVLSQLLAVLLFIIAIVVGLYIPEIRRALGLDSDSSRQPQSTRPVIVEKTRDESILQEAKDKADQELRTELVREKAAREAAERTAREAEERSAIWRAATIVNRTEYDIYYEILESDGSWKGYTVKPGAGFHNWKKNIDIKIKYKYCLNGRQQERTYYLPGKQVIGHEPTESERGTAPAYYFSATNREGIAMYQN